jgi:hypothetical protein
MPNERDDEQLKDEELLDNLVGLHLIEEVRELWICGQPNVDLDHTRELNEEIQRIRSSRGAAPEDFDDVTADETRVLLVRIDGEEHALFNRDVFPILGAVRQRSMTWPFASHGPEPTPGLDPRDDATPLMCNLFWRPDSDLPLTGNPDRVLVAVDETKDRIVLEIGVERYAYQVPGPPLLASIPLMGGSRVPPGHSIRVLTMPQQMTFRPSRLIIGRNPESWVVENIRFEGQNQAVGDIPGGVFAASYGLNSLMLPTMQTGQNIEITARYTGEKQHGEEFIAALFGEVPSNREPVTRIGRRFVARWTPEGRFEPWLATHLPGRDQVTGEDLPA